MVVRRAIDSGGSARYTLGEARSRYLRAQRDVGEKT